MGVQGAQKGRNFLLKKLSITSGSQYDTVGGLQATSLTINGQKCDITSKDDAGYQTLLAGAGVTSFAIAGNGVFKNDFAMQQMETACINKTLDTYRIFEDNGDFWTGSFQVEKVEYSGPFDKEVQYTIAMASSGIVTPTKL